MALFRFAKCPDADGDTAGSSPKSFAQTDRSRVPSGLARDRVLKT